MMFAVNFLSYIFIISETKMVVKMQDQTILDLSQLEMSSQISANQWNMPNFYLTLFW